MGDQLFIRPVGPNIPAGGLGYPSAYAVFRGYVSPTLTNSDDWALQSIPSGSGTTGSTFLVKHQLGTTGTSMFAFDGSYPGLNLAQVTTPAAPAIAVNGTPAGTSYTYAVVAYSANGNTPGSATTNTATGAATLTSTNSITLQWNNVSGATKYCVWRTASSGTPSSVGNIGCISALMNNDAGEFITFGYAKNALGSGNLYSFIDTGLAGDSASLPATNTTGGESLANSLTFATDNTSDIGDQAHRPRDLTLGRNLTLGSYVDITEIATPANPGAGTERVYSDSGTHLLTCLTPSGGSCLSTGGGGGTVTSVSGTAAQITVVNGTTTPQLSIPASFTFPGTVTNNLSIFGATSSSQLDL